MALADVTINDGQGTPVAHTFSFISNVNGRVVRSDLTRSPDVPLLLTMAHSESARSGGKIQSHLWRIDNTILDGDGVTAYVNNIRIMSDIFVPVHSDALADDFAAFGRNWLTSANLRAFLRGSVF